ncbi:hypothetical protein Efla_002727 [Eimeria flavescens]
MSERHSESVQEKLSLSLDEIIALNNKQQKQQQQQQKQQQQKEGPPQPAAAGPQRRPRGSPAVAAPYARRAPPPYVNGALRACVRHGAAAAVGYSVKVVGLPTGLPWPRVDQMVRRSFGFCGTILGVVPRREGEAWIQFADVAACRTALAEMQNAKIGGGTIIVERGNPIPTTAAHSVGPPAAWGPQPPMWGPPAPYPFAAGGLNPLPSPAVVPAFSRQMAAPPPPRGPSGTTVIVTNVPLDLTTEELADAFSCVGGVAACDLLLNRFAMGRGASYNINRSDKQGGPFWERPRSPSLSYGGPGAFPSSGGQGPPREAQGVPLRERGALLLLPRSSKGGS